MSTRLKAIARETVEIAERGWYRDPQGAEVRVDAGPAVAGTRLYLPTDELPEGGPAVAGRVEVTGESTLAAARRLGDDVAALVFASARNPGGGFLNGAQAQEESVARSSALYPCLRAAGEFYAFHRAHAELTYTDRVIYSPGVPVFRDDKATLLTPYPVTFLTSARAQSCRDPAQPAGAGRRGPRDPAPPGAAGPRGRRRARPSPDRAGRVGLRSLRQRPRDSGGGLRRGADRSPDGARRLRGPGPEPERVHGCFSSCRKITSRTSASVGVGTPRSPRATYRADVESVWDYPRPPRLERSAARITVVHAGVTLVDSDHCWRVLETSHPPVYYVPAGAIAPGSLERARGSSFCEFKGTAGYWDLVVGEARVADAAWSYERPAPAYAELAGAVAFYPSRWTSAGSTMSWSARRRVTSTAGGSPRTSPDRSKVVRGRWAGELPGLPQEGDLRGVAGQLGRPGVGGRRLLAPAQTSEQVGPDRMEQVVLAEVERLYQR
jgi:uncharacterized protein (DUF427 family)